MAATTLDLNNAGVVCMRQGRFSTAWDLFKGALELHLADEKKRADPYVTVSKVSEDFIRRAQIRYQRFIFTCKMDDQETCYFRLTEQYGEDEDFCHLFLFRDPLEIPFHPHPSANLSALTIILNLALLEHYKKPFSGQVIGLYRLAASLLSGVSSDVPFEVVIVNNAAVWFQQCGDTSMAEKYMNRLAELTRKSPIDVFFTSEMMRAVQFNLDWFASPRYRVSPAA